MKNCKYDFETILQRKGMDASAYDSIGINPIAPTLPDKEFDLIPMWVADMNFMSFIDIQNKIIERAKHPSFGYFLPRDEYYQAIIDWHKREKDIKGLESKYIDADTCVIGGLVATLEAFSAAGDSVLLHSPTYTGFTNGINNIGRKIIHSPLYKDENGIWRMDYEDMEEKIKEYKIHCVVFCSPHNPTGRVWTREELEQAMDIFKRNSCIVISDEIWSDLVLPSSKHIPTLSVSDDAKDRTIALYAPSKTFNLAGLKGSYRICLNDYLRDRVNSQASKSHYNVMNLFSMYALIGAYSDEGYNWLLQLRQVLANNMNSMYEYLHSVDGVDLSKPQGTYLLLPSFEKYCQVKKISYEALLKKFWQYGLAVSDGRPFHFMNGIRMNIASPSSKIEEAIDRMKKFIFID